MRPCETRRVAPADRGGGPVGHAWAETPRAADRPYEARSDHIAGPMTTTTTSLLELADDGGRGRACPAAWPHLGTVRARYGARVLAEYDALPPEGLYASHAAEWGTARSPAAHAEVEPQGTRHRSPAEVEVAWVRLRSRNERPGGRVGADQDGVLAIPGELLEQFQRAQSPARSRNRCSTQTSTASLR